MKFSAHYIKNKEFRTIYVSGAIGGIFTSDGTLNMTFFTERPSIPKSIDYEIDDDTNEILSQNISEDSKVGVIREVYFSANMDIKTAERIQDWLKGQIDNYKLRLDKDKS